MILKELPISSVLAVKFTCRAFYARTLNENGSNVVDLKRAVVDEMPLRSTNIGSVEPFTTRWAEIQAVARILIDIEMRHRETLWSLTCSICARSKPYGPKGFGDKYFSQRELTRYCNACLHQSLPPEYYPEPFLVQGEPMRHCPNCDMVVNFEDRSSHSWSSSDESFCAKCGEEGRHSPASPGSKYLETFLAMSR